MSYQLKDTLRAACEVQKAIINEDTSFPMPHRHGMVLAMEMVMDYLEDRTAPLKSLSNDKSFWRVN